MTKKNNNKKKPSVKSEKNDKPKKNIVFLIVNKKNNDISSNKNSNNNINNKDKDDKNNDNNDNKDNKDNKIKNDDNNKNNDKISDDKEDLNENNNSFDDYNFDDDNLDEDYQPSDDNLDEDYDPNDDYDEDDEDNYNENDYLDENNDYLDDNFIFNDDLIYNENENIVNEDDVDKDDENKDDEDEEDNKLEDGEIDEGKNTNKKRFREDDEDGKLDNLFRFIITGKGGLPGIPKPGLVLPDRELNSKRKYKKKKIENFYDYFKEARELTPINKKIENLQDLIDLGETYDKKDKKRYVINMKALHKCLKPLKELNKFIGMKKVKEMILDLIFLRLQNIEDNLENEMWHLVIQGSPGCGKTEVSRVIGKLYYGLGIVDKNEFTQVKRSQLIGKFCGHTAAQTQEIFDKAEGGVLFIDEAYSLGNPEQKDSFTKECIDTINQNLTEKKRTVVIIAGYKEQLDSSFFSYNPGLARRFKMRLSVDNYNFEDLRLIYLKKLHENGWDVMDKNEEEQIPVSFFEKNIDLFKFNGGDMENLWSITKMVHCRRIFGKDNSLTKKITKEDLYNALEKYKENEEVQNRDNDKHIQKYIQDTMYC